METQPVLMPNPETGRYLLAVTWGFGFIQSPSAEPLNVVVPPGFDYDGASIPRAAWSIIGSPFDPAFMAPALAHDRLYHTHKFDRPIADALLRELLIDNGVSRTRAAIIYRAVRMFGGAYWPNDAEDAQKIAALLRSAEI